MSSLPWRVRSCFVRCEMLFTHPVTCLLHAWRVGVAVACRSGGPVLALAACSPSADASGQRPNSAQLRQTQNGCPACMTPFLKDRPSITNAIFSWPGTASTRRNRTRPRHVAGMRSAPCCFNDRLTSVTRFRDVFQQRGQGVGVPYGGGVAT